MLFDSHDHLPKPFGPGAVQAFIGVSPPGILLPFSGGPARFHRLLCPLLTSLMRSGLITLPSANSPRTRRSRATWEISQGKTQNFIARKRRIYKAHPNRRWRTSQSRARSSRVYHTSYPVPVRRPALSDWASSRPRLATTPLPFSLPSALRIPGHRTCTYEVTRHARRTRST